jgi:hypothetical protein
MSKEQLNTVYKNFADKAMSLSKRVQYGFEQLILAMTKIVF